MLLIIGIALVVAWIFAFILFHVTGFLIHLLLIFAFVLILFHFIRAARK